MINLNLAGKTAIVTGASRGIGKAIAESLLKLNCRTIITSTSAIAPAWSKRYKFCTHRLVDFMLPETLKDFLREIERIKKIDILVNNAGVHIPEGIRDIKKESWDKIMKVNLEGPAQIIQKVAIKMKCAKAGKILNISSIAAFVSRPGSASYSASKAGLIGLTRACALDLAPYNILVNALCPGHTQTDMITSVLNHKQCKELTAKIPLKRFAEPEEIAKVAVFLCSDLNTYITGQAIVVDGGITIQ